eukprot:CAMPEP_0178410606 /NCGR_PEP_ID=MMETSP0689_2-20121128/21070_1 /TAXON_ID=160604 /ORGANISM="Amphidinium massartii, Strain CS-259" /LENGTH=416 /DNA_ID=CAMNT_0020031795 /DNA_START=74 /DNA_END=1321 /DNA_ORIENTATION=+
MAMAMAAEVMPDGSLQSLWVSSNEGEADPASDGDHSTESDAAKGLPSLQGHPAEAWPAPTLALPDTRWRPAGAPKWQLVWCHEKSHKREMQPQRWLIKKRSRALGATLKCFRSANQFQCWMEGEHLATVQPYILVTGWYEVHPCLRAICQRNGHSVPTDLVVLCCDHRHYEKAMAWAGEKNLPGSSVGGCRIHICEQEGIPEDLLGGIIHSCFTPVSSVFSPGLHIDASNVLPDYARRGSRQDVPDSCSESSETVATPLSIATKCSSTSFATASTCVSSSGGDEELELLNSTPSNIAKQHVMDHATTPGMAHRPPSSTLPVEPLPHMSSAKVLLMAELAYFRGRRLADALASEMLQQQNQQQPPLQPQPASQQQPFMSTHRATLELQGSRMLKARAGDSPASFPQPSAAGQFDPPA